MKEIDFNSDDWKEKLKGKSPEEIARLVENYYKEKYGEDRFWTGKMVGIMIFISILILIFIILYRLLNKLAM